MRARAFVGIALAGAIACGSNALAQSAVPAAPAVQRAVALIKEPTVGTAFAFRSQAGSTLFLTAAHVIGCKAGGTGCVREVDLYLGGDLAVPQHAHVISHGDIDRDDLAVLALPEGPLPALDLAVDTPHPAARIAVMGYPDVTVPAANRPGAELDITLSLGAVTASAVNGFFEFSGTSYHGDSGGPIFNPDSGSVIGVVHGQSRSDARYQGVGATEIAAFLGAHRAAIDVSASRIAPTPSASPIYAVPNVPADCESRLPSDEMARCYAMFADRGDAHAAYLSGAAYLLAATGAPGGLSASEGMRELRAAADAHDPDAEIWLGEALKIGLEPFARDIVLGSTLQQRAWDDVRARADTDLHAKFLEAKLLSTPTFEANGFAYDPQRASAVYRSCAQAGSAECALGIATLLRYGKPADKPGAIHWLEIAAQLGSKPAMMNLGFMYEQGEGVPVDLEMSAKWYRAAFPDPLANLSWLYVEREIGQQKKKPQ